MAPITPKNLVKVKHSFVVGKIQAVGEMVSAPGPPARNRSCGPAAGVCGSVSAGETDGTTLNFAGRTAVIQRGTTLPLDGDMRNPEVRVKIAAGLFD